MLFRYKCHACVSHQCSLSILPPASLSTCACTSAPHSHFSPATHSHPAIHVSTEQKPLSPPSKRPVSCQPSKENPLERCALRTHTVPWRCSNTEGRKPHSGFVRRPRGETSHTARQEASRPDLPSAAGSKVIPATTTAQPGVFAMQWCVRAYSSINLCLCDWLNLVPL